MTSPDERLDSEESVGLQDGDRTESGTLTPAMQRFVRVLSSRSLGSAGETLLGERVPWLKRLIVHQSLASKLSEHPDYEAGNVLGMDAASAFVVEALDPQPGLRVLDLCCAPGVKLAAIAELMDKKGLLMGVDVSLPRLNTTAALLRKYRVCRTDNEDDEDDDGHVVQNPAKLPRTDEWDVKIWHADGRTFDPASQAAGTLAWSSAMNEVFIGGKPLRIPRKRAGKGLRKILERKAAEESANQQREGAIAFDRILVDAECTTDGRSHVPSTDEQAYKKKRWSGPDGTASRSEQQATEELQLEILRNGFRLLRPGGFLVYSTCSLLEGQNEGVLSRFLQDTSNAKLVFAFPADDERLRNVSVPSQSLGYLGLRLTPESSGTSGMFLAKLTKVE